MIIEDKDLSIRKLADVKNAKNYIDEKQLKVLNNLVSGYFDFAEIQAMRKSPIYMQNHIEQLVSFPVFPPSGSMLYLVSSGSLEKAKNVPGNHGTATTTLLLPMTTEDFVYMNFM